jgi:ABC-type microcin C transport system permease subunit YejB
MIAYVLLILVVVLIINFFAAGEFQDIASMKGYSDSKYFWYCFFLSIVGYLMVVALPAKTTAPVAPPAKNKVDDNDELPEI